MSIPIIDQIGGEETIRRLVDNFYDIIESDPAGRTILNLHLDGHGLLHVREEQFYFLCGFFGGRNYYLEKHGHMNVKQLHNHVPIRSEDAENWLKCMDMAITKTGLTEPEKSRIQRAFKLVAQSLVNEME